MPSLFTTGLLAFALCLLLTLALRACLRKVPQHRSRERDLRAAEASPSLPRLGGVAVLLAAALALGLPPLLHWHLAITGGRDLLRQWAGPVGLVMLLGAADDLWNLRPHWKFLGQLAAALWVVALGVRVHNILFHPLPLWASALVTVLWLVGCSNAFNLIDGLDGLATGLALFATGTVLAHAVLIGEPGLALVMGALFGALGGFLLFNFPPASIYLGDAGSLAIGFFLGCMALAWANKANTAVGLLAPFFALLVPMLDTGVAIVRRGLTGQPLLSGDHRHIHHRLLRRGLTPRGAMLMLYAVAGLGAVVALVLADVQQRHTFELVILLFVALAVVGVQQLGYVEFSEASRLLRRGLLDPRPSLQAHVLLRQWSEEIARAPDLDRIWTCVQAAARALHFDGVELSVGAAWRQTRQWSDAPPNSGAWALRLPLGPEAALGEVTLWRQTRPSASGLVDDIAAELGAALAPRLAALDSAHLDRAHAATSGRS
ncbi:MAG TPA: MraY family glycosyltransferase [Terriglobales bacterium]|nr:MraY family glycosyltransferase [Terriglobales bacterium]